mgnify:FL=1
MKVIFLDIDGVLAHTDYLNWQTRHIDPERVRFLAKIVELTDAQIVLTSTWKNGYDRQSGKKDDYYVVLEHVLAEHDLKIYDITDNIPEEVLEQIPSVISLDQLDVHCKHGTGRAAEVEKWLMDHQADGFVILDDEDHDWSDYGFDSRWIQTSWYEGGLQEKDVAEAVRILQNKEVRPECT